MRVSRSIAVALTGALIAPATAIAAEPWGGARTLERAGAGTRLGSPSVALDRGGRLLAAWTREGRGANAVVAARGGSSGGPGRPRVLLAQSGSIDSTATAFGANGIGWTAFLRSRPVGERVGVRGLRADGTTTVSQLLTPAGGSPLAPRFVAGPGDEPLLAWERDTAIELTRPRSGNRFERPLRYALSGRRGPIGVARGTDGSLWVTFVRADPAAPQPRVFVARQAPGERRLEILALSDGRAFPREPQVAVAAGRVVVAWTESDGRSERVVTAQRRGEEPFEAPRSIPSTENVSGLRALATGGGRVLVGWLGHSSGPAWGRSSGILRLADVGPATTGILTVSRAGERAADFTIEVDRRGGATLGWIVERPGAGGPLHVLAIPRSGRAGTPRRLTARGERTTSAALGVGPAGDAAALWISGRRLRLARRPG